MKDHLKAEIANTETARTSAARSSGERVWLAPGLARSLEPLLSGLGIELLAPADRERATIRVESVDESVKLFAAEGGTDAPSVRLRIERADGRSHERPEQQSNELSDEQSDNDAIEFEGPGCVWAAASCVVSQAFGLSPPLLTADAAMFAVIRAAARAGQVDSPILVTGETGTGKELLVRLIHAASGRAGGMSSVNCAALNDPALGSRKIDRSVDRGVDKDAISDAARGAASTENRLDELCVASDTTLFLDQVSELSSPSQTRVLRAILRAGDSQADISQTHGSRTGDFGAGDHVVGNLRPGARLVSATNRPLGPMVLKGRFKRELYDRLAVLTLGVPPLRERRADIELLAAGFLRVVASRLSFTPEALSALGNYPFPGNVRELHNLVTRFAIMQRDEATHLIQAADVRPELAGPPITPSIWKSSPFRMRREMALQALMVCGGDRTAAARKLGISVRALQQHVVSIAPPARPRAR
jgi:transcriptional regulator with GAF, ATPase, and Fis domain